MSTSPSIMTFIPTLVALALIPAVSLSSSQSRTTLASLRHDYRPLLMFAASEEQVREQMEMLAAQATELQERQVVVIPIVSHEDDGAAWKRILPDADVAQLEPGENAAARRRFHISEGDFSVILIGKDGGEKLRSSTPVTMERLIKVIDSMPMRQKEVRDGHTG